MPVFDVQRRYMELGRVRLGERGSKGEPKSIKTFRFTSPSEALLEDVAAFYGGTVQAWTDGPSEGYYEVTSKATELRILMPPMFAAADGSPTTSWSQWYELWSGGGCQRRCDGVTEAISGKACMCNAEERECKITTRISFMLPDIRGMGIWRLDSKGWNAASELPGTLELLVMAAAERQFVPAVLRVEERMSKKDGLPRKFVVPVIDLPGVKMGDMLPEGYAPTVLNAPVPRAPKPELPAGPQPPAEVKSTVEEPDNSFGPPPEIQKTATGPAVLTDLSRIGSGAARPAETPEALSPASVADVDTPEGAGVSSDPPASSVPRAANPSGQKPLTKPMADKLNVLVGELRDEKGVITTEQLWKAMGLAPLYNELDGICHWAPLRDLLTRDQGHQLIDRLEALREKVGA